MNKMRCLSLATLSSLILYCSCTREISRPIGKAVNEASALIARPNFSAGPVKIWPVSSAVISTLGRSTNGIPFRLPVSVVSDGAGKIWVADYANNWVVCYSATSHAVIKTFGKLTAGSDDGAYNVASFNHPNGLAIGPDGLVYVTDMYNHRIRTIDPVTNTVGTFAGTGVAGFADGPLSSAKFNLPSGIAIDVNGTIYITEEGNHMVRRITNKTTVTRWCGQTTPGATDAAGANASFNLPRGIAVAPDGAVYVADQNNNKIRRIVSGNVTTFAGSGLPKMIDGNGIVAAFNHPSALATDSAGNIYVADQNNFRIRLITPAGKVSVLAGNSIPGYYDDYDTRAQFLSPDGITVDPKGYIYITDQGSSSVRKLTFTPGVKTLAGSGTYLYEEGTGANASFNQISAITMGPDGNIYLAEYSDGTRIRKVTPDGTTSFVAGSATYGFADGPAAAAIFGSECSLTVAPDGIIYVADWHNNRIRKIANGQVTTFAGDGREIDVDGTGVQASFSQPEYIASDSTGNLYTLSYNGKVRRITPAGLVTTVNQIVTPFTMTGLAIDRQGQRYVGVDKIYRFAGDNQPATVAADLIPYGLTLDPAGNFYTGSRGVINVITPAGQQEVLVGNAVLGGPDINGPVSQARFYAPNMFVVAPNGIVYVCEWGVHKIRMLTAKTAL